MFLMQFICREYMRCMQKRFKRQEEEISHNGRGFPLYVLLENGKPILRDQKEIAAMLGIAPSTMTGALKRLEQSGLIQKHQDPADQRRKLIGLTDEGIAFMKKRRNLHKELNEEALAGMSEGEQSQFLKQLTDIYARLLAIDEGRGTATECPERQRKSKTEKEG